MSGGRSLPPSKRTRTNVTGSIVSHRFYDAIEIMAEIIPQDVSDEDKAKAVNVVCGNAADAAEATDLLAMLGLEPPWTMTTGANAGTADAGV